MATVPDGIKRTITEILVSYGVPEDRITPEMYAAWYGTFIKNGSSGGMFGGRNDKEYYDREIGRSSLLKSIYGTESDRRNDEYNDALEELKKLKEEIKDTDNEIENTEGRITNATEATGEAEEENRKKKLQNLELSKQELKVQKAKVALFQAGVRDLKRGFSEIGKIGKDFLDVWGKIDQAAGKFSKSVGISAVGMDKMRADAIGAVKNGGFGVKYNVDAVELLGMQTQYSSETGRNIQFSGADQENMAAMSALMGDNAMSFATAFERFGLSYTEAAKNAGKMFKEAGKYGINFQKYADNVQKGLSIAQNYTFRNGVRGLEEMAKKATAIRLDMQQIANFAEKVNSVEGAVDTGAKLQVLGGPFARFSDPLGMLNESLNDIDGLMDRFTNMVGGLARFDAEKGTVDISSFNKQRVKAAAEAMGMNYSDVIDSIFAQGRQKFVGEQIEGKGYSEEMQEFLKNTATIQDGKALVSYLDKQGKRIEVDLAKDTLTADQQQQIRATNQSESDDVKDIANMLRDYIGIKDGTKKQYDTLKAQLIESTGLGKTAKKFVSFLGNSNTILWSILGITNSIRALLAVNNIGSGGRGLFKGLFGKGGSAPGGKAGRPTATPSTPSGPAGPTSSAPAAPLGPTTGPTARASGKKWGKGGRWERANKVGAARAKTAVGRNWYKGLQNLSSTSGVVKMGGAAIGGQVLANIGRHQQRKLEEARESGEIEKGSSLDIKKNKWNKAMNYAGNGASIGALVGNFIPVVGPLVGAAAGALVGGAIGYAKSSAENKENKKVYGANRALKDLGITLSGEYSGKEMDEIMSALSKGNGRIREDDIGRMSEGVQAKLKESGDLSILTSQNAISAVSPSAITPRSMSEIPSMQQSSVSQNALAMRPIEVEPVECNVIGTIRVEGEKGVHSDIPGNLLSDSSFISKLSRQVQTEMSKNEKGGNIPDKAFYT